MGAQSTAARAAPRFEGGRLVGILRARALLRFRQRSIDLPSSYIVDYVSRLTASHSATLEEVAETLRPAPAKFGSGEMGRQTRRDRGMPATRKLVKRVAPQPVVCSVHVLLEPAHEVLSDASTVLFGHELVAITG